MCVHVYDVLHAVSCALALCALCVHECHFTETKCTCLSNIYFTSILLCTWAEPALTDGSRLKDTGEDAGSLVDSSGWTG